MNESERFFYKRMGPPHSEQTSVEQIGCNSRGCRTRSRSYSNRTSPFYAQYPIIIALIVMAIGFIILILTFGHILISKLFRYLFNRKQRNFHRYLESEEMQKIKNKYFDENITLQLIVMNTVIIDDVDTLCVFPLNEQTSQLIDERISSRLFYLYDRLYFRYLFIHTLFGFSKSKKQFYTIKSPFGSKIAKSSDTDGEKEEMKEEWLNAKEKLRKDYNIENHGEMIFYSDSSEEMSEKTLDTEKEIPFDPKWLKEKNLNLRFLSKPDYSYSSLYMCFLIRDFLVSKAIFGSKSEKFIVCFASPFQIELRVYEFREKQFCLSYHRIFNFFFPHGMEVFAYVLEKLTIRSDGSELNTLLKSLDNSGSIPRMKTKNHTILNIH